MNPEYMEFMATLLKERSGLILSRDKMYLLESRLTPLAQKHGLETLDLLIGRLRETPNAPLVDEVVEAMTTNETLFFRDNKPFDHFRDTTLPALAASRADVKKLRIWCAAASTGQEPYTLSMILKEQAAKFQGWQIEVVATDISSEALERAKSGKYTQFEVQRGLPIQILVKYFKKHEDMWDLSPEIISMVTFKKFNLLDSFKALGVFDVVFCRNVLIYFDRETKADILDRMSVHMAPDACLYLGGAETVFGITETYKLIPDQRSVYRVDPDRVKPAG